MKEKSFEKKYKDIKLGASVGIVSGIIFFLIGTIQMITNAVDPPSIFCLVIGFLLSFYNSIFVLLYWKSAKYIKNNQPIPKKLRIISGIFLIFSLALNQIEQENERYYLILKEWRFYILLWIFCNFLAGIFEIYAIQHKQIFWVVLAFLMPNVILFIDIILTIIILKYQGTKNKLLKYLTIITLNYRNYKLYKKIIELNTKEYEKK